MWDYWQKLPAPLPEKKKKHPAPILTPTQPTFVHLIREFLVHLATERQLSSDSFYKTVSWQEIQMFYPSDWFDRTSSWLFLYFNAKLSSALHRKAPRRRWSWAGRSPPSSPTSPSGRSCWRRRRRRSSRRRWCSRGTSWRRPTRSPPLWGRRRPTPAVTNPSRWAAAFRRLSTFYTDLRSSASSCGVMSHSRRPPMVIGSSLPDIPPPVRVGDFLLHLSLTFFFLISFLYGAL